MGVLDILLTVLGFVAIALVAGAIGHDIGYQSAIDVGASDLAVADHLIVGGPH